MTLIAYGPTRDSDAIVGVDLNEDGSLTVTIELEVGEEVHTLPESAVAPEIRALAMSPSSERAA